MGFRALATAIDPLKKGQGHDPDWERTYDWLRQLGRFTDKKDEIQKSVPSFAREEKGHPFSLGPVKSEILVAEWPNGSRPIRWKKEKKRKFNVKMMPCDSLMENNEYKKRREKEKG